ncbi:MAG: hypothetical protein IT229_06750 [Flavobacteriales bacterium]|nr:hypothetical protein [Flavobacteriales bacterium]
MSYRLANLRGVALEQLKRDVSEGAKLVTYAYTISPLAFTLRNVTAVYMVKPGEKDHHWVIPTIVTGILGWWSIPNGFMNALSSIRTNLSGGLDVTTDVLANLDEDALNSGRIEIQVATNLFHAPTERNITLVTKAVNSTIPYYASIQEVYLGLFMNTAEGEQPFHVIGVQSDAPLDAFRGSLITNLRKDYYKHVRFEIISMDSSDLAIKLNEQGRLLKTARS